MAIRYRTVGEGTATTREGQVENMAELEALATLGSLSPSDEVALDGSKFQKAAKVPELRGVFREKGAAPSGAVGNLFLWIGVGMVGLVALGLVAKVAAFAIKLAVIAAIGAGAIWVVRKLLR